MPSVSGTSAAKVAPFAIQDGRLIEGNVEANGGDKTNTIDEICRTALETAHSANVRDLAIELTHADLLHSVVHHTYNHH
jgi:hypothetical protein